MSFFRNLFLVTSICCGTHFSPLWAQQLDSLAYVVDGKPFLGFVAKPAKVTKNTKTILIVHEWWGLNEYPKTRALQLAKEGFIAICIDMYGKSVGADNPNGAGALSGQVYADTAVLLSRFMAGYQAALTVPGVQANKMAAIGYCFGGNVVLNAAKMGAPLDAVVSFHGGLNGAPLKEGRLQAAVLVCNGADDRFVPQTDIDALATEMTNLKGDYTFINYPNSTHAFTNPNSTATGKQFSIPIAYNAEADAKSWADFKAFVKKKVK
jgi:dienelactone hydrolase